MIKAVMPVTLALLATASQAFAQGPLHVDITDGTASPLLIAIPEVASGVIPGVANGEDAGAALAHIVRADLSSTGLYRFVSVDGRYSGSEEVAFAPFVRAGAQALVLGRARPSGNDALAYDCVLYDVFGARIETSQRILVSKAQWRRAAHKCADMVFAFTTGDQGHFDTRLLVIGQAGSAPGQGTSLLSMDFDGENRTSLSDERELVAMPRFGAGGQRIIYASFAGPGQKLVLGDLDSGETRTLDVPKGVPFAPRFSPDGASVIFSLARDGEADIHVIDLASGAVRQLTSNAGADTSPSYSPDGTSIAFESDRSGEPQVYVMASDGSGQKRISFGAGAHGSPTWSPRGDLIAFTKIENRTLRIGVMKPDGSRERIITEGGRDEDPAWAISGRAIAFQRTAAGDALPAVWITDLTGKLARQVKVGFSVGEPAWSEKRP
jgi:TolB protein